MKTKLIILSIAALCLSAAPAQADLFRFSFDDLKTAYSGTTFTFTADKTTGPLGTTGSVTRYAPLSGKALFNWTLPANIDPLDARGILAIKGDFQLTMTLSNITATTADAVGSFIIWDVSDNNPLTPADTIFGDLAGVWTQSAQSALTFDGLLSGVGYTDPTPGNFDGHSGAIDFAVAGSPPPWVGTILQITATAPWFTVGDFDVTGGSLDATIVPVPGAVLLGILGLSAAGIKLRRFA